MTNDIDEAIEYANLAVNDDDSDYLYGHMRTIRTALLVYKKLMDEPSNRMIDVAIDSYGKNGDLALVTHFKAMRDQLIREVEEDV